MQKPKRPITENEREQAFKHIVSNDKVSPISILSLLLKFEYRELEKAKALVKGTSHSLTVGDLYVVWNALSSALDHHDEDTDLEELEALCASIVTGAWDSEMALSDKKNIIKQSNEIRKHRVIIGKTSEGMGPRID